MAGLPPTKNRSAPPLPRLARNRAGDPRRAGLPPRTEGRGRRRPGLHYTLRRQLGQGNRGRPHPKETRKLLNKLGINGHRNFYVLRHTFRTIADGAKDQPAADFIMGHEVAHMSSVYRETISDDRLRAVTDHVRQWLFSPVAETKPEEAQTT
jgi:integrase